MTTATRSGPTKDPELWQLLLAIATGDEPRASRLLAASPRLAMDASSLGATRSSSQSYFIEEIAHHVYEGDTALHIAAAAHQTHITKERVGNGGGVGASHSTGAQA